MCVSQSGDNEGREQSGRRAESVVPTQKVIPINHVPSMESGTRLRFTCPMEFSCPEYKLGEERIN